MDDDTQRKRKAGVEAAQTIALAVLINLLVKKGVISKDDIVRVYSALSNEISGGDFAEGGSRRS